MRAVGGSARASARALRWLLAIAALMLCGCGAVAGAPHPGASSANGQLEISPAHGYRFSRSLWKFFHDDGHVPGVTNVIDDAEQTLEIRCMREAGFRFYPVPNEPAVGGQPVDGLSDMPGPEPMPASSLLRAAEHSGYGIYAQTRSTSLAGARANVRYFAALSTAAKLRYRDAEAGNPHDTFIDRLPGGAESEGPATGCQASGDKAVYGSLTHNDYRLNAIAIVSHQLDVRVQPAVNGVTRTWSRCMRARSGRSFSSPGAVIGWVSQLYSLRGATDEMRQLEIRYATASVRCMYATGWARTYARALWNAIQSMPTPWYRTIVRVHDWDLAALARARSVLRRTSTG